MPGSRLAGLTLTLLLGTALAGCTGDEDPAASDASGADSTTGATSAPTAPSQSPSGAASATSTGSAPTTSGAPGAPAPAPNVPDLERYCQTVTDIAGLAAGGPGSINSLFQAAARTAPTEVSEQWRVILADYDAGGPLFGAGVDSDYVAALNDINAHAELECGVVLPE